MNKLRVWVNQHPVLAFVLFAYGFSWGLWALMIAVWGVINWLGSFGPSFAAIAVVAITRGRAGLKDLLRPIFHGRFGLSWYAFILVGAVLLLLLGTWLYVLLGGTLVLPSQVVLSQLPLIPLYFVIVFFIGGPLGEEIGWRGYLLPQLLKQKDGLYASLVLWIIWFIWHLPLFWLPGASQAGASISAFLLFVAAWSVIFTWVYLGTAGSLLAALLLHTSVNTLSLFIQQIDAVHADAPLLVQSILAAVFALIVIAVDKRLTRPAGTAAFGSAKPAPGPSTIAP